MWRHLHAAHVTIQQDLILLGAEELYGAGTEIGGRHDLTEVWFW